MQRSLFTRMVLTFLPSGRSVLPGFRAPVGQDAMARGISHMLSRYSWSMRGGLRWKPTTATSEQWQAPHMFRQQATATRTMAGIRMLVNSSNSSSMMTLTVPEASVAGVWQ